MKSLICILSGLVLFAACTTTNVSSKNAGGKSANKQETVDITLLEWRLVSVVSESVLLTTEDVKKQSTLRIEADGKIHGQGGCNVFFGVAKIDGAKIKFDKIGATQMACLDMKIETAFFNALRNADSYVVELGDLKLKKGNDIIATFSTSK